MTKKAKMLAASVLAFVLMCPAYLSSAHAHARAGQGPQMLASFAVSPAVFGEQEAQGENGRPSNKAEKTEDPNEAFRHSGAVKLVARIIGGDPGKEEDLSKAFWLCMALNFVAIFVVLWVVLRKPLPAIFRNRTEAIQRRLEEARKTSEEARHRLAEVEARLSRLDVEIEQMRREAEDAGRHEEERVMAAAEEERRRIVESAEQEIARAANAARRELKAYAAELGVSLAEKKIRIEANTDQKLVRDFTARLGKDGMGN